MYCIAGNIEMRSIDVFFFYLKKRNFRYHPWLQHKADNEVYVMIKQNFMKSSSVCNAYTGT